MGNRENTTKNNPVNVRISDLEKSKLDELMEKYNLSMADVIRMCLWDGFNKYLGDTSKDEHSQGIVSIIKTFENRLESIEDRLKNSNL